MEHLKKRSKNQREGLWPCNARDKNEIVLACVSTSGSVVCMKKGDRIIKLHGQ